MMLLRVALCCVFLTLASAESCYEAGTDYDGAYNDLFINHVSVTSSEQCQRECQLNTDCAFWTYYADPSDPKNGCFLRTKEQQSQITATQNDKCTSGPKYCTGCYETETDYDGAYSDIFMNHVSVKTAEMCQKQCQITRNCAFWTLYDDPTDARYGCFLRTAAQQSQLPATHNAKCTSGPVFCQDQGAVGCLTSSWWKYRIGCPKDMFCYNGMCNKDPCGGSCVANAECELGSAGAPPVCSCAAGYTGDPTKECLATFTCGSNTCTSATQYCPLIKNKCLTKKSPGSYCTRHVQCSTGKCIWVLKKFSFRCSYE